MNPAGHHAYGKAVQLQTTGLPLPYRILRNLALLTLPLLAACGNSDADSPVRITLPDADPVTRPREPLPSPDVEGALWQVSEDGRAIHFGLPDEPPYLTLACRLTETPPQLRIIRHVEARPDTSALFPVIGNGMISRFKMEAVLNDGEWRWEGTYPADAPALDVFTGTRDLEATLPGAGSLVIEGSRLPGEFVTWCRLGGKVMQASEEEQAEAEEANAADD
ncbi:hypothetical protein D6851_07170 [Altericroceibacterium spongiae]|uniref:Uncharacterized protein n=1 Tax=Altericroceibacterium spongiae TaxID=2320269 RepID=A0A420EM87_9SPHN|nr:hypothetical protein [Altericroceibacterium spongiae]RKF21793.1 hypothetical protein D6851_07170 [Altericroceibacterium spongiae]